MCSCGQEPETILYYLLRCDFYSIYPLEHLNDICALTETLKNFLEEIPFEIFTLWIRRLHFPDEF